MARFKREQIELTYRFYVTDSLRMISLNTAKQSGGEYTKVRYADIYSGIMSRQHVEEKTGEEIILEVIEKTGIKLIS